MKNIIIYIILSVILILSSTSCSHNLSNYVDQSDVIETKVAELIITAIYTPKATLPPKPTEDNRKLQIYIFIKQRYDYYDQIEGRYVGDKYSDEIFQETAEKFNISLTDVNNIWLDTAIMKKFNNWQYEATKTVIDKNIPSNAVAMYVKGDRDLEILCATSKENYSKLIETLLKDDDYGFSAMIINGEAFMVAAGTRVLVLEKTISQAKIRILEGSYINKIAWVGIEQVQ